MKKILKGKEISKQNIVRFAVAALLIVVMAYSAISLATNYADIGTLKTQAAQSQKIYEDQEAENERIKAILDSKNKDEYIEQKAREKGYVKSGETVYYDISSSK